MATGILFWSFSLPVGFLHRLRHLVFDSTRQPHYPITLVVGTRTTFFTKSRHPQRPKLGAFALLALSFLTGHQPPQWLPGGVASVQMWSVVWVLLALDIQPILVQVFYSTSKCGFLFRIVCICCPIFVCRQLFD